jgi:tetrachlorobenzoquinone reductase
MEPSDGTEHVAVRLSAIADGATDIKLFEFEPADGAPFPAAAPGAHVDLHLPNGMVRQYSLLTPRCTANRYVIGVKRQSDGRGGSRCLHEQVKVGDLLSMSAPRNHFALNDAPGLSVLLAGGIGITPIYAMYEHLLALGKPVRLHYWCRSPEHALFLDRLEQQANATIHCSDNKHAGSWLDLATVLADLPAHADVYCCGPQKMLDEATMRLSGRADIGLHVERFHPTVASEPDAVAAFDVSLARRGLTFTVPAGRSILDVLREASIDLAYSCEEGVCGACETKVVAGLPIHRDSVYSAADHERRGTMMICCSGSRSERLVLDL